MKLKYKEISTYRQAQLIKQNNCCALCGETIVDDAVLDHDHKSGLVRLVLHRGCNALLGKLENNLARNLMTPERLTKWAENIVQYRNKIHTDLVHPRHKEQAMGMGRGRGRGKKPPKR